MRGAVLKGTLLLAVALVATGCSSLNKKSAGAAVENKGISSGEMSDIDAARSQGMAGGAGGGAAELNDPNSPLYKKVIYFDYDSSEIRADNQATVQAHAAYLAAHPQTTITLEGHTDERGSREYNLALGERRAYIVRNYLKSLGINPDRMAIISYGEEKPLDYAETEGSMAKNRRAEFVVRGNAE